MSWISDLPDRTWPANKKGLYAICAAQYSELIWSLQNKSKGLTTYTERKNDLALNQKSIKIKFCENGVNSDLKMI